MRILLLSPERNHFEEFLKNDQNEVIRYEDKLNREVLKDIDFIISFGYRHIIKPEVIKLFLNKIVNLHISYLPYNRGADPNLWSFLEKTPAGVTIHYIDEGIDTGDILCQKMINFSNNETLVTSYNILTNEIEKLFYENWEEIKHWRLKGKKQDGHGTFHLVKDKEPYLKYLINGWDTPIDKLIGLATNSN